MAASQVPTPSDTRPYRIAVLDIESLPNVGYAWEARSKYPSSQNLIDVSIPWVIASYAVKWVGEKGEPTCLALPDFPKEYRKDRFDDTRLMEAMRWEVFEQADLVVGHNIRAFDIRKSNTRMFKHGQSPPPPFKTFDTLIEARRHFYFPSNKLGDLAKFLGCPYGGKMEHEGFQLWVKCMNGDPDAWERMKKYNKQDVRINEWVYKKIRPWSKSHPNITLGTGRSLACPVCGSPTKWVEGRWNYAKSYRSKRYDCTNRHCRKSSSGSREKLLATVLS